MQFNKKRYLDLGSYQRGKTEFLAPRIAHKFEIETNIIQDVSTFSDNSQHYAGLPSEYFEKLK